MDPTPLPLITPIGARYESLTQDGRLINGFAEKSEMEKIYFVYKRPGALRQFSLTAGTGLGIFNWNDFLYSVVGTNLYKGGTVIGTVDSSSFYYFTAGLGASPKLFLKNLTHAYYVDEMDVVTAVVDADYPAVTVAGTVYLDGTFYVMDASAHIQGSDAAQNDPSSWDPLNVVLAQIEAMPAVMLTKQLVYILAMKEYYTEAFYDAGNAAGSPLAQVQGAKMNFGCVNARTVCDCGGDVLFVGTTREGGCSVVMVSNLQLQVVSTSSIDRILEVCDFTGNYSVYSLSVKMDGHRFYIVTMTHENISLVFDISTRVWYQWTDPSGNYFPYVASTVYHGDNGANRSALLHESNGGLFTLSVSEYGDDGIAFPVHIYTPNYTGGSLRSKTLARMDIVGDMVDDSTLSFEYSDDDYQTWSATYTVDMGLPRPTFPDLGEFYRRAFHFSHQDLLPFRIQQVDLYLGTGT